MTEDGLCTVCRRVIRANSFRDVKTVDFFLLTGTCQKCQDWLEEAEEDLSHVI